VVLGIATAGSTRAPVGSAWRTRGLAGLLPVLAAVCAYRAAGAAGERAALGRASAESRLDALQGVVDAHPYLDQARRQRGLAWLTLAYSRGRYDPSRLDRARADLEAVVRARPQWAEARVDLGWVNFYGGRRTEARAEMRTATSLDPTHMGVGLAYAQLLAWSGETAGAIQELARLRRINPAWTRQSALDLAASWTRDPALLANVH
jgi:predicted Zn-dependent protease